METAQETKPYEVKLDFFQGPLDLLLYLVRKEEVDIMDIQISCITDQYIRFLETIKEMDLELAGEFLVMASILMRLKANELLPQDQQQPVEIDGEIIDPEILKQKILEYARYKDAARWLRNLEEECYGTFFRGAGEILEQEAPVFNQSREVVVFDLVKAFQEIMERARQHKEYYTESGHISIDDRIEHTLQILYEKELVDFECLFSDDPRRKVLVVTFIALLELVKLQKIGFRQESPYQPITVYLRNSQEDTVMEVMPGEPEQG